MPYDTERAKINGRWAVKEWRALPLRTRKDLFSCLWAADFGIDAVRKEWAVFAAVTPMRIWEAVALCDVLRYLVNHVSTEARAELMDELIDDLMAELAAEEQEAAA